MYRYLALIWDPGAARARAAAESFVARLESAQTSWSKVLEAAGLVVFHADRSTYSSDARLLPGSAGVVLGRVFTRDIETPDVAHAVSFDVGAAARIVSSGGRLLFEKYWGRYVAIVRDDATDQVWVLRDPSGGFPCWYTSHAGVAVVCSDIDDCAWLDLPAFTVNWSYIAGLVAHATQQVRDTALHGVSEVQAGERLHFRAGVVRRSIEWDPIEISRTAPLESPDDAISQLRTTTLGCVHAWAALYPGIVHNLSGGLDSSIVVSCLKSAPSRPNVTCVHYYSDGPNEDERRYARLMSERVGVDLVERELDPRALPLRDVMNVRRAPRPWFYIYELEHGAFEGRMAAERAAQGLFSGAGGDGVFYQAHADLAVADHVFAHGLGGGLLATAIDAARVSRKSIWPLLWQAVRNRVLPPKWDPIAMAKPLPRTLINSEVVAAVKGRDEVANPWLSQSNVRGVAPGILWHIMSLSGAPAYYSSFDRSDYPERTLPLLSQPLVELCLRIPTYVHIRGGYDRAIARQAFVADLPGEIVRRSAKGRADRHYRNVLDANLEFVREIMLDGLLVREGMLDRETLELYLTPGRSPGDYQYTEILQEHVCTEAWLRSWLTNSCGTRG